MWSATRCLLRVAVSTGSLHSVPAQQLLQTPALYTSLSHWRPIQGDSAWSRCIRPNSVQPSFFHIGLLAPAYLYCRAWRNCETKHFSSLSMRCKRAGITSRPFAVPATALTGVAAAAASAALVQLRCCGRRTMTRGWACSSPRTRLELGTQLTTYFTTWDRERSW